MANAWHYLADGEDRGPISTAELKASVADGIITPRTAVRRIADGRSTGWLRAGQIEGLFNRDVSAEMGSPICKDCGFPLSGERCLSCNPLPTSPSNPPIFAPPGMGDQFAYSPAGAPTGAGGPSTPQGPQLEKRYGHLRTYLGWMDTINLVCATAGGIIFALLAVVSLSKGHDVTGLFSLLCLMGTYAAFVAGRAGVQAVWVLIDTEENTRRIAENTAPR